MCVKLMSLTHFLFAIQQIQILLCAIETFESPSSSPYGCSPVLMFVSPSFSSLNNLPFEKFPVWMQLLASYANSTVFQVRKLTCHESTEHSKISKNDMKLKYHNKNGLT